MTDRSNALSNQRVVLSWAATATPALPASHLQPGTPVDSVERAGPAGGSAGQRFAGAAVAPPAPPPAHLLPPQLRAVGLPVSPAPELDAEDRSALDQEELLRAAIALDLLATWTEPLQPQAPVLGQLCEQLFRLAELGGVTPEDGRALAAFAADEACGLRAGLSQQIAALRQHAARGGEPATPAAASDPETVASALRTLEQAADLLVREVTLRLQAQGQVEYWQG